MKSKLIFLLGCAFNQVVLAEPSATDSQAGMSGQLIMLGVLFFMMYFLMIRPQSKKAKDHKKFINELQKGDEIVTNGGLLGKITKITDNFFVVMFAEGVEVVVQKQSVVQAMPKGTIKSL